MPADVLVDRQPARRPARCRPSSRRRAGSGTAGSTRTSPRRCPSCRSRGARPRRTSGTSRRTKASDFSSGLPSTPAELDVLRQEHRQVARRAPARRRRPGSGSPGSACPSSAGARSASRAGGSRPSPCRTPAPRASAIATADRLRAVRRAVPGCRNRRGHPPCGRASVIGAAGRLAVVASGTPAGPAGRSCGRTRSRAGRAPGTPMMAPVP